MRGDDRGSLPLAMLIATVGLAISAMLGSALLSQVRDVRRVSDRGAALGAAEAGLQVALGQIRAAVGSDGKGRPGALPCGPLDGTISAVAGNAYQVEIVYRSSGGGQLTCPPAYTPSTAWLRAWEVNGASTVKPRILEATYKFRTPDVQIPMGLIRNYPNGNLCMDAGSSSPAAGDPVLMTVCDVARPHRQMFAYVHSMALAHDDMCVEAARPAAEVTFQKCVVAPDDATTQSPPRQLWTLHAGHASFAGTDDAETLNGWCLQLQNPATTTSTRLIYAKCPSTVYNPTSTMMMEPSVGAGAAGESTEQLVNYKQFGRCMDVTEGNVNYGYLIAWPCTANPVPANISWNQRFTLPAVEDLKSGGTGRVTTVSNKDKNTYCLRSPRSAATGQYVTMVLCGSAGASEITWRRYRAHKDAVKAYTLVDSAGLCLAPSETEIYTRTGDRIGRIKVAACDGGLLQKWNAIISPSTGLTDIDEE